VRYSIIEGRVYSSGVIFNSTEMITECRQQTPIGVSRGIFGYRILWNRKVADITPVVYTLSDLHPILNHLHSLWQAIPSQLLLSCLQLVTLLPTSIGPHSYHRNGPIHHSRQAQFSRTPSLHDAPPSRVILTIPPLVVGYSRCGVPPFKPVALPMLIILLR
jgi:hypothetical protein